MLCHFNRAQSATCHFDRAPSATCHFDRAPSATCHFDRAERVEKSSISAQTRHNKISRLRSLTFAPLEITENKVRSLKDFSTTLRSARNDKERASFQTNTVTCHFDRAPSATCHFDRAKRVEKSSNGFIRDLQSTPTDCLTSSDLFDKHDDDSTDQHGNNRNREDQRIAAGGNHDGTSDHGSKHLTNGVSEIENT